MQDSGTPTGLARLLEQLIAESHPLRRHKRMQAAKICGSPGRSRDCTTNPYA